MFTKNHNRYLVEEGISLVRKHAKFFALKDMTNEDYIECKLSLLSKVVSTISNIQFTLNIYQGCQIPVHRKVSLHFRSDHESKTSEPL